MRIAIASDHGGFKLKAELVAQLRARTDLELEDLGAHEEASVDYPDFAEAVAALHGLRIEKEGGALHIRR